ncbi:MAG TPA: Spo0E family sporulation regulatory protein-aspartic acid phosphatase [Syntrophomonadaceae bacterium]|nr:Spo0E family sporulation regulatory protein-aspartic acid phosphatase [Syntrophomonadaceae bacterium]
MSLLNLSKVILQIEKTRNKLISVELSDQEKLLEISRKMDELILEYYRLAFSSGLKPGDSLRRL